jgi:hypothetical protein
MITKTHIIIIIKITYDIGTNSLLCKGLLAHYMACLFLPLFLGTNFFFFKNWPYMYIHACMHACMHAYIRTYTHIHVHTYVHTYINTSIHTYMHTHIPTHAHPHVHTCMHACIHSYIHTHTHTHTHIYTHTQAQSPHVSQICQGLPRQE